MRKIAIICKHIEGLPIMRDSDINIKNNEEYLQIEEFKHKFFKKNILNTFNIKFENIIDLTIIKGNEGKVLEGSETIISQIRNVNNRNSEGFLIIKYLNKNEEIKNLIFKLENKITLSVAKQSVDIIKKELQMYKANENNIEL
ncbi:hypothetical protein G6Z16_01665 [Clostridium perfringens]|uniref:hypothetical protein n=1 Tax=Clostridium perfringens TaxID=1502 RepID=UPI0013E330B9|nr:hypothetical protein [Clostridium perfringens]NGT65601.1 hypothetical protein [Clostridium perfringens]